MNRLHFFVLTFVANFCISQLNAQSEQSTGLGGYWQITNDALGLQNLNYLKITPLEDGKFLASYIFNEEKIELSGDIHDVDLINAIETTSSNAKNMYNGTLLADGTISGFYSNQNTNLGRFKWVKICDDLGNAYEEGGLPCAEPQAVSGTTTNRMVKKTMQVQETVAYIGESRNENLPIAQTVSEIPANAIIVGHIGLDSVVTYKTVEVEVPEEIPTEASINAPIKKPSNTAATKANKKVVKSEASTPKKLVLASKGSENVIPTAYDSENQVIDANNLNASAPKALPKLNSCDAGSSNPSAVLSSMVRGTTIVEKGHTYHIVGAGETMTAISKIYNVNIMDLAEKNNKDCERIIIGEKLIIK